MGLLCQTCPKPAAIPDIDDYDCPINFDQIVKMAFQRRDQNSFANLADLQDLAVWTPLLTAVDDTKIQVTPFFSNFVLPASEPNESGGNDNTTVNGIPEFLGMSFVAPTGQFKGMPDTIAAQLALYTCESLSEVGITDLVAYFFTRDGKIIHFDLLGFDIYNFYIAAVASEGFQAKNIHNFGFKMLGTWSYFQNQAVLTTPNFNPLTDL